MLFYKNTFKQIANFFAASFQSSVLILVVRGNAFFNFLYMEGKKLRNKENGFPNQNNDKFQGEPRAKPEFSSKRADGSINTHPQERMRASNQRT